MAKTDKPNILILWGDDIGMWNISHFSRGMMGYRTPEHRPHRERRASPSPTTIPSRAARPAARASSPARTRSAPA